MKPRVHQTALIEDGVEIGDGTAIWDNVHVRAPARIGSNCIVGEKTYIAYDVDIDDLVKINARVYICAGVTIERGVMLSAGVTFTNDRFPRATTPDLTELLASEPGEETLDTLVKEGTTIGAGAIIGPGLEIGRFAMIGMGSVVTRSVGDHELVVGNPARLVGIVCRCGNPVAKRDDDGEFPDRDVTCDRCGRTYSIESGSVTEQMS